MKRPGLPVLSMLDLLTGMFGSMIVIATVLSLLRYTEGRAPFFHIVVRVAPGGEAPGGEAPGLDVSGVVVMFEVTEENGDDVDVGTSLRRSESMESSAMLLVRVDDVRELRGARVGARLPSLITLLSDQDKRWFPYDTQVRIEVVIMTESGTCARDTSFSLDELEDADAADDPSGPSLFAILADDNGQVCQREVEGGDIRLF